MLGLEEFLLGTTSGCVNQKDDARLPFAERLKSKILQEFDQQLRTELDTDLYSFVADVKLDEGESFHDTVDAIFSRDGASGLREFLESLFLMLNEFRKEG